MNFLRRHVGNSNKNIQDISKVIGLERKELIDNIIPNNIKSNFKNYDPISENKALKSLKKKMSKNGNIHSMIGLDFSESYLPFVIKRNILENPGWYTSYTPYQAEISQGRLESLFNYQTLISELTGLPISNCSLLDTCSASVEALNLSYFYSKEKKKQFFVCNKIHPHIIETLKTRACVLDIDLVIDDVNNININDDLFGFYFSYPNTFGEIDFNQELINELKKNKSLVISHNDIMSLLLYKSPGELGVDISLGSTQRFGLPLWFGGPHSTFFATQEKLLRLVPGRIIGESKDRNGAKCYRMALQTREQHIRKEKATSNICTSQALLANTSSMYAIYHGKQGLIDISKEILKKTIYLKNNLKKKYEIVDNNTYSSFLLKINKYEKLLIFDRLLSNDIEVRKHKEGLIFNINETTDLVTLNKILYRLGINNYSKYEYDIPLNLQRDSNKFLNQGIFKESKSETDMMRYINSLTKKDYSLMDGMIPLGSCTMKLNSTFEMEPLSWESIQNPHPYTTKFPEGYKQMIEELGSRLKNITGMTGVSFQPNAGSMGEYTGLFIISKYHKNKGNPDKNICLIPESAHGTNFTSAKLCNMDIIKFKDDISIEDFENLIKNLNNKLSCMMITYPNTYGIFDENIKEVIDIVHRYGGLVYMDGANMNAQCGITSPGECGADVCHLNLHKTFCIPHGGGGPGMGPILVNDKLKPLLPSNIYQDKDYTSEKGMITNSNYSSASILTIPYLYLKSLGSDGVKESTVQAIMNANYLKKELENYYKIYSTNSNGFVGHEFIVDLNEFKKINITDKDVAKRLLDYSFHPPTMSWPVPNSLMIEPTESESKEELDRFISAMKNIRKEIDEIEKKIYTSKNNVLVNSPHTIKDMTDWKFPYSINKGCFPVEELRKNKFWPSNSRIDDVYGDKNLLLKL